MIKIKKVKRGYQLFIDDVLLDKVEVSENYDPNFYEISTTNIEDSQKILIHKWNDFPNLIAIKARLKNIGPFVTDLFIETEPTKQKKLSLRFDFDVETRDWKGSYSFSAYIKEYEKLWSGVDNLGGDIRFYESDIVDLVITFLIVNKNEAIIDLISKYRDFLTEIHQKVDEKLSTKNSTNKSFDIGFNFPEELKIPCEQYLQYFARFLQDLGINATSNLKEEAGKVLFSVTPTDDIEALDKIREALAVYLNLPNSPILDIEDNDNFAIMRLKQQVENLQHSQRMTSMELRLAQKVIEDQDKLLKQSYLQNEQFLKVLEKITSKSIMMDSAENKEEFVKIYEGAEFSHSKWLFELTGIKLNPVKVIETAVKNTLSKGDEIIELGLDKKDNE